MTRLLLAAVDESTIAIPLSAVATVLRRVATVGIAGVPPFVLGVATVRGEAVPVVDTGTLMLGAPGRAGRLVVVKTESGLVALQVSAVLGIHELADAALAGSPPLLAGAADGVLSALQLRDPGLAIVLDTARVLAPETYAAVVQGTS